MMKGILKRYSRPASSRPENNTCTPEEVDSPKKRVSFDSSDLVKVFEADEWDRSPAQVTLKLTCKDVAELRELNISLIRPGPLAMERTKSKRPTPRSANPQSPSLTPYIPSSHSALQQPSAPTRYTPVTRPSSPIPGFRSSSLSSPILPALSTRRLPGLLEDPLCAPMVSFSTAVDDTVKCDEFEGGSLSVIRSPPGLSVPASTSDASASLVPSHSSPPGSIVTSSKPPSVTSAIPLYRPPHLRAKFANSFVKFPDSPTPVAVPTVTRGLSEKVVINPETFSAPITPFSTKASELIDLEGKAESVSLVLSKDCDKNMVSMAPPPVPVLSRRTSRSLMGWELKRGVNTPGKLGFGLVRKQQVSSDSQK